MKKIIEIKGMMCEHCKKKVEDTLSSIEGVKLIKVNLDKNTATISTDIDDNVIIGAIKNAGYSVINITEKKGIF